MACAEQRRARPILGRLADSGPFGFGASSLGNLYAPMGDEQAAGALHLAWASGVRYFDTAPFYGFGLSEQRLGAALAQYQRDEYILSTKVGRLLIADPAAGSAHGFHDALPFRPMFDYTHDGVLRSVEQSLLRLKLDRIDILLMHDIGIATHGADHAHHWRDATSGGFQAMRRLREEGVVTAIGLGVNEVKACAESLDHVDLDVFLIAGRFTLLDRSAGDFLSQCHEDGIGIVAAGVYNSGLLATGSRGGEGARFDYEQADVPTLDRVAAIERVCTRYDVPLPAAAHRFVQQHPAVTQTLVGLRDEDQVARTVTQRDVVIPPALWRDLVEEGLLEEASLPVGQVVRAR